MIWCQAAKDLLPTIFYLAAGGKLKIFCLGYLLSDPETKVLKDLVVSML